MSHRLLAALATLTFIGCGNPTNPAGEDLSGSTESELKLQKAEKKAPKHCDKKAKGAPVGPWSVQVSNTSTQPTFQTDFPIATTYDLYLAFDIPVALAGQHLATFELTAPNGAVYQSTDVAFSTGASTKYRVWSSLPVAGTFIQQFAMAGTWSVQVFLDGEAAPRATGAFVLE